MGETSLSNLDLRKSGDRQVCVLVVEDDPALQRMILNYFVENNIRTLLACGRQEMVDQLGSTEVNLVILDLRLGQEDGLDLLREIRSSSDVPVIIITGHRRDDIDRVVGLELGADDYLTQAVQSARIARACPRGITTIRCRTCCAGARSRAGPLSILRLAARLQDPAAHRPGRRSGNIDQRRVRPVDRLSRGAAAPAQPGAPSAVHARA